MAGAQGVGQLDAEMGILRNYLTTSSVLVNALKEVAATRAPTLSAPKDDAAASSAADVDWAQTTEGLRYLKYPLHSQLPGIEPDLLLNT